LEILAARERVWRYRSLPWLEEGWRDLRFAVRSLARTPGFTSNALLVIDVGIGANTAVFSVVDAVLLKPVTYPDPQALLLLVTTSNRGPIPGREHPRVQHLAAAIQHLPAGGRVMGLERMWRAMTG
jgi:putative ABC transport system permease protein